MFKMWANKKEGFKMVRKTILILSMLFNIQSCASITGIPATKKHRTIHEEFKPYVEEFVLLSKGRVTTDTMKGFTMGFSVKKKSEKDSYGFYPVGVCYYHTKEVHIDKEWWDNAGFSQKKELVFHELGHCILKRGHTYFYPKNTFFSFIENLLFKIGFFENKGFLYDKCPASIMHPRVLSSYCFDKHFMYYINELFDIKASNYVLQNPHEAMSTAKRCGKANVINKTKTWNDTDISTLKRSHDRCLQLHNTCLKTFIKKSKGNYHAICY